MRVSTFYLVPALFLLIFLSNSMSKAAVDIVEFESQQQEQLYRQTIDELRCVVCQNQNLADSDAPLAQDLREITANMVRDNKSKHQIKQFMVERYGEFVLYRPPLSAATSLLWFGPFIVLFASLLFSIRFIINRQKQQLDQSNEQEHGITASRRKEIQALLSADKEINTDEADNNA